MGAHPYPGWVKSSDHQIFSKFDFFVDHVQNFKSILIIRPEYKPSKYYFFVKFVPDLMTLLNEMKKINSSEIRWIIFTGFWGADSIYAISIFLSRLVFEI